MIIGIDGNEANVGKKVGIGEYAFELLRQFEKYQISTLRLRSGRDIKYQIYLKEKPRDELPKERDGWEYRIVRPKRLWTQIGLPIDLYTNKPRPDVFFSPSHYAPRFSPVPTVISVMDLSYIYYPEMFKKSDLYQLKNWTSYSIKNAKKVITISQVTKNDIIKVYKVPEGKVIVTYPGVKEISNMNRIKDKYGIEGEYLLFVGTLQPRKNIVRLIEAFSKVAKENESLNLIIVGKKGWLYEEILAAPRKFNVEPKIKFLDFTTDEELERLYQNAVCFVLPSLYEGFGLPILEAMKNGCPVITSNISSLPEAGGEAAIYIDPNDVDDIASKILKVIKDKKLREEMTKKGYQQIKKFSWEKTARETLKVLEEIGNKKYER